MITPRLTIPGAVLRPWAQRDAKVLVQAWTDPDVADWNVVPPEPTLATASRWIGGVAERAVNQLALDWVIDIGAASALDSGVVGEVGLSGFSVKAGVGSKPRPDSTSRGALIGYWLLPRARGQGLAASAVREATAWAHATLDLTVVVARCHETNYSSQRVAERAGFVFGGVDGHDHQLWRSHQ